MLKTRIVKLNSLSILLGFGQTSGRVEFTTIMTLKVIDLFVSVCVCVRDSTDAAKRVAVQLSGVLLGRAFKTLCLLYRFGSRVHSAGGRSTKPNLCVSTCTYYCHTCNTGTVAAAADNEVDDDVI